jgi:large subunit ribosomal protein L9e
MRDVLQTEELEVPEGITIEIKSRVIKVTGPRGTLTKNVRHVDMDIRVVKTKKSSKVTLAVWQGGRKHVACLRTIRSLINNMVIGVTKVCAFTAGCFSLLTKDSGLSLQNARRLCPFPHQRHHPR